MKANSTRRRTTLWGIYHQDVQAVESTGNPLRTVVRATSQIEAEEQAATLGFGDAFARPVTHQEAKSAQWREVQIRRSHPRVKSPSTHGIRH